MKWAAKRTAPTTHSLTIKAKDRPPKLDIPLVSALKDAFQSHACLSSVKYFDFEAIGVVRYDWRSEEAFEANLLALAAFRRWIFEQAPTLEALRLLYIGQAHCVETQHSLIADALRLQHLKHLEMDSNTLVQGIVQASKQLQIPTLETLFLHKYGFELDELDVRGCQQLRPIVQDGSSVMPIQHEAKCYMGIGLDRHNVLNCGYDESEYGARVQQMLGATRDLVLCATEYFPNYWDTHDGRGVCEHYTSVKILKVIWPVYPYRSPKILDELLVESVTKAGDLLRRCMPSKGRPLGSLTSLIVTAKGDMECCIPKGLPKLEELVLFGKAAALVSFEDPLATLSVLNTC